MKDSEYFYIEARDQILLSFSGMDLTDIVQLMTISDMQEWGLAFKEKDKLEFFEVIEKLIIRQYHSNIEELAETLEREYHEDQRAQAHQDWIEAKQERNAE